MGVIDYNIFSNNTELPRINEAILNGCELKIFSGGSGVRTAKLVKNKKEVGYGEGAYAEEAISNLEKDLTGNYDLDKEFYKYGLPYTLSHIDSFVAFGSIVLCKKHKDKIVSKLEGYSQFDFPKEVENRVKENWASEKYSLKGLEFECKFHGKRIQWVLLTDVPTFDFLQFTTARTGFGDTLLNSLSNAFNADEVYEYRE